jgi:hypothetical protein
MRQGFFILLYCQIEIALKGVSKQDRCQGHANDPKEPGFFSRMFGKK